MIREIFGKKLGMTQVFADDGTLIGVTLIEVEPVCILEEIKYAKGDFARIGCFKWPEHRQKYIKKPVLGYFKKLGVAPYKLIREVAIDKDAKKPQEAAAPEATEQKARPEVGIEMFNEGEIVNIHGTTKGRGFAGGIKRHGWHGGPSAHGSMTHRRIGSNGANTDPGRVVRGHHMPGHMGVDIRVVKQLKVVKIDKEKQLLFIAGSIPGGKGSIVAVEKA
ncbi:MAG: 50S ribosomal protein L3 [Candidatus Omnitrophica bacterium]|jgi:large subunit ribosomal protein L3|nr:50S ribosomal protein L3 [Candidatus Omnitrophota bacterium]